MTAREILHLFKNVRRNGDGWTARCPAHDDAHNSLSIGEGDDGRVLLYCHAGCSVEQVCVVVNLEVKDLMPETSGRSGKPCIVKVYDYTDEAGTVLYQNCRFEPKDFRQRVPDNKGGFTWKLNGVRRVPYNLVGLLQSELEVVFLTEGEKDADNLSALGLLASSLKNWRPEFNQYLSRFPSVVILQDHDRAGVKQASDAARVISGSVRVLKVVDLFAGEPLPDKGGKDVSDWLEAGGTAERLLELVAAAPLWSEGAAKADDAPLSVVRMADVQAEEVGWFWHPYVPLGKLTILEGDPGLGKSWVTCALAAAVSRGKGLPGAEPFEPGNVLMLSAEDGLADTLRPRLDAVGADVSRVFALSEPLTFDAAGLLRLEAAIIEYSPLVVVIDPLFAYTGGK
ncbi:MAG: AAA family ATPase, partial [Acidobacteriota bacterium]|nr:AAA family ATPase [Acidobacteriota bacterium]